MQKEIIFMKYGLFVIVLFQFFTKYVGFHCQGDSYSNASYGGDKSWE